MLILPSSSARFLGQDGVTLSDLNSSAPRVPPLAVVSRMRNVRVCENSCSQEEHDYPSGNLISGTHILTSYVNNIYSVILSGTIPLVMST